MYYILPFICLVRFSLGDPWLKERMKMQEEFDALLESSTFLILGLLPFVRYLPIPAMATMRKIRDNWMAYLTDNIEKHEANYDPGMYM